LPWYLPNRLRERIRTNKDYLINEKIPLQKRSYLLYLLVKPQLDWLKNSIVDLGLEPEESDSETYLICTELLEEFKQMGSSLLYYIETRLPWKASALLKRLSLSEKEVVGLTTDTRSYPPEQEEDIFLRELLFGNRWLAENLSDYEKLLIIKILTVDSPSGRNLAKDCWVDKTLINEDLRMLAGKMKGWF